MTSAQLRRKPRISRPLIAVALLLVMLSLAACDPADQRAVQTAAASAAETALASGKAEAGTQVVRAKETGVALAATKAAELKETAVAAGGTAAAQVKGTAEAEIATRIAPSGGVSPAVQAARDQLSKMPEMQSHWKQVNAPLQNVPGERSPGRYADVVDQFEVDAQELAGRYQSGGAGNADTRCNIFAGDVMRAMGVALPTKGNLGKGQGSANSAYTDPMTAQAVLLNDYLNRRIPWVTSATDAGVYSDWVEVDPTTSEGLAGLIAHVGAGKPALVSDSGHIAVVRPDQVTPARWQEIIIAQAGAVNFLRGPLKGHFTGTPQFFTHD